MKTNIQIFSIFILLCFSFVRPHAQTYFGIRGGGNIAYAPTSEDGRITKGKVFGINSALYFDFTAGKKISIQPELAFVQKGFKSKGLFDTYAYTLNYWNLNVLTKYKFSPEKKVKDGKKKGKLKGYAIAGPYIGGAASGKRKNISTGDTYPLEFNKAARPIRLDLGLVFGGGIEIPTSWKANFMVDLRYDLGLISLISTGRLTGKVRNRAIIFSVGYAFLLGR